MPVFAVSGQSDTLLAQALKTVYPDSHRQVWPGLYFVIDEVTTQQVGEKLGISDGSKGFVFICSLAANYWGFGPKDAWEWLDLKRKTDK